MDTINNRASIYIRVVLTIDKFKFELILKLYEYEYGLNICR